MNRMMVGVCGLLVAKAAGAAVETGTEMDIAYAAPERCRLDVRWLRGTTNLPTGARSRRASRSSRCSSRDGSRPR